MDAPSKTNMHKPIPPRPRARRWLSFMEDAKIKDFDPYIDCELYKYLDCKYDIRIGDLTKQKRGRLLKNESALQINGANEYVDHIRRATEANSPH